MAVIVRWSTTETSETDYDETEIHRATSESGVYSLIATQAITDNTYFDQDGTTSLWYKVRFNQNSTSETSGFSDPLQGGTFEAYCTIQDIRAFTNLTTSDISDSDLLEIMLRSQPQINPDLNIRVIREPVKFIDNTRENRINGTNTTYYIQNWRGNYIADNNNDGDVTISDIIYYQVTSTGTETTIAASTIDDDDGSFVLSTAPGTTTTGYITYSYSSIRQSVGNVDPRLRTSFIYLVAANAYAKINIGRPPTSSFGSTRISRDMKSFRHYFDLYKETVTDMLSFQEGAVATGTVHI